MRLVPYYTQQTGCVRYIPMARMVNTTNAKAEDYLGLQNLIFRCFVPSRCQEGTSAVLSFIVIICYSGFWSGFCLRWIKGGGIKENSIRVIALLL